MKQITLNDVIEAFGDEPVSIADRLNALGASEDELSQFSAELLSTRVYASSFVKFLHDNKERLGQDEAIASEKLPDDFKNVFEQSQLSVRERLIATGMSPDEVSTIFDEDLLNLSVDSNEFMQLLQINQKQFLSRLGEIVSRES